jgi:hypothetical protein
MEQDDLRVIIEDHSPHAIHDEARERTKGRIPDVRNPIPQQEHPFLHLGSLWDRHIKQNGECNRMINRKTVPLPPEMYQQITFSPVPRISGNYDVCKRGNRAIGGAWVILGLWPEFVLGNQTIESLFFIEPGPIVDRGSRYMRRFLPSLIDRENARVKIEDEISHGLGLIYFGLSRS